MARKAKPARAKPGAGSVYQDKRGYWHALWTPPGGERRHFGGGSEDAVRAALTKAQDLHRRGVPVDMADATVGEYLTSWLAEVKPSLRPGSWEAYETVIRLHLAPALGGVRLTALHRRAVAAMMASVVDKGLAPQTANRARAVLVTALRPLVADGLLIQNPASLVRPLPERPRAARWMDATQAAAFLAAAMADRDGAVLAIMLLCALRRGEAIGLRWPDWQEAERRLVIERSVGHGRGGRVVGPPKTKSSGATLALSDLAGRILAGERQRQQGLGLHDPAGPMFITGRGRPMPQAAPLAALRRVCAAASLPPIHLHGLRHSAGALADDALPLADVSRFLRHSSPAITARVYLHPSRDASSRAAAQIDALFGEIATREATQEPTEPPAADAQDGEDLGGAGIVGG